MNQFGAPLDEQWRVHLQSEFDSEYMRQLSSFLQGQEARDKIIYPAKHDIFASLNAVPPKDVKVVILGQDPYHGPDQAHGLSFSVPRGLPIPPSLLNIYKEIEGDVKCNRPMHGDLNCWAKQGVLLLNSVLTVEQAKAGSHQNKGWEKFTDAIINTLDQYTQNTVFLLWGAYAQKKGCVIDQQRHLVLQAPHPSPLSAYRGFFGCRHFSKTNDYLLQNGYSAIDWQVD